MKTFVFVLTLIHVSHHASVLVQVSEGGSALLPCSSSKPLSDGAVVEWLRDTPPLTVHIRRSDRDQPSEQDRLYQRRTAMKADAYKSRDLSLTLNDTTIFDKGVYICSVTDGSKLPDQEVELKVHLKDDAISRRLSDLRDAVIVVGVFTGIGFIGGSGYLLYKKYTKG
ncbi:V-set domain-containing T-cell activation inhibitor 1-like isoform X2 [Sphaeramia orbicularis]|nr:V-set domain-containing T-cell activation inhibitor 1-like isoform X2 [Sphaeramia orbicularis]